MRQAGLYDHLIALACAAVQAVGEFALWPLAAQDTRRTLPQALLLPQQWVSFVFGGAPRGIRTPDLLLRPYPANRRPDRLRCRLLPDAPLQLAEDELRAGQVEEGEVVLHLLLPAHQEPS
jgi:hypothetical protein